MDDVNTTSLLEPLATSPCPTDGTISSPMVDPTFEPQARARSNTWPLRPTVKEERQDSSPTAASVPEEASDGAASSLGKKGSSRRNAWGNMSYADLITKAIQSSSEQRLTLAQIYEWMVQNVVYFKDKGDSNSSAGWKNSIRHNLSLHARFMRVQNEATGKSSWWVLNPDAKPGKSPRRRAASMDTKTGKERRGRVKKRTSSELLSEETITSTTTATVNTAAVGADMQQLSPPDYRTRAGSNASSVGRLSPIDTIPESEAAPSPLWPNTSAEDNLEEILAQNLQEKVQLARSQVCQSLHEKLARAQNGNIHINLNRTLSSAFSHHLVQHQRHHHHHHHHHQQQQHQQHHQHQQLPQGYQQPSYGMLTEAANSMHPSYDSPRYAGTFVQNLRHPAAPSSASLLRQALTQKLNAGNYASHTAGVPSDLRGLVTDIDPTGLDCDVEQIIKHELSLGGSLDFNFEAPSQSTN